ncbi:MAG: DNA polymerase III subunit beta, partial [Kovacikia sp.]
RTLIPKKFEVTVTFNRVALIASLERVSLFASNSIVKLDIEKQQIKLTAQFDEGDGDETLTSSLKGKPILIAFNSGYLIEALKAISEEEAVILLNSPTSPALLTMEGFEHLLMPVQCR